MRRFMFVGLLVIILLCAVKSRRVERTLLPDSLGYTDIISEGTATKDDGSPAYAWWWRR